MKTAKLLGKLFGEETDALVQLITFLSWKGPS
jgi:hypothetical protein